jgi:O-antigen ligase
MLFLAIVITVAVSIPHPVTKQVLMGVVGVFIGVIFLKDLKLALCLLPVLIPAQNLVPKGLIPIPGINYETLLMGLMLGAWMAQRGRFEPKRPANGMPAFVTIFCLFLGWVVLAALRTFLEGKMGLYDLFSIFKNEWVYLAILFVVSDSLRDERDRVRLMVAVCIGIILTAIQPIYKGTQLLASGVSLERHRAVGILALQANIYGGALACFAPFPMMYFARKIGGKKGRVLFGVAMGVAAYTLVLTLSRGSWLAFGTAVAVIGLLFERRVLYILAVGALTAPFWVPQDAVDRGNTISEIDVTDENLQDDEGSAFVRVDQWKMIPKVLADSPILGHGYQSFPLMYYEFGSLGRKKGAHVGYAEYAAELGVPGLALYVSTFVGIAIFGLTLAWRGSTLFSRSHGVGLLAAALAMMVAEAFGSRLKVGTVTAFLWMYAGVAIAAWRWPARESVVAAAEATTLENQGFIGRNRRLRSASKQRPVVPSRSVGSGRGRRVR